MKRKNPRKRKVQFERKQQSQQTNPTLEKSEKEQEKIVIRIYLFFLLLMDSSVHFFTKKIKRKKLREKYGYVQKQHCKHI